MAKNESRRLIPSVIAADRAAFNSLANIKNYSPSNPAYSVAALEVAFNNLIDLQAAESQALAALQTARDNANAGEWACHNLMLGSKDQVIAQFGKDSNEVQALGLKKKSEYKRPAKKTSNAK